MKYLNLSSLGVPISAAVVCGVLQACPTLRSTHLLNAEVPSLTVFSDPTVSATGKCLAKIYLQLPQRMTQESLTAFLTQLQDPSTPLSLTLHSLRTLGYGDIDGVQFDTADAKLLERVLCVNRRLKDVFIFLRRSVPPEIRDALRYHSGDLVLRTGPVPESCMSERRALLSVVRMADDASAVSRLDVALLRHIFEFAEPLESRTVQVF